MTFGVEVEEQSDIITEFDDVIRLIVGNRIDSIYDTKKYIYEKYGVKIFNNQVDVFDNIINPLNHYIFIAQARGGGKTYSVGLSVLEVCLNVPGLTVGVFAPKLPQTTRLIAEVRKIGNKKPEIRDQIDWNSTSTYKVVFKNGSFIEGVSAHEQTLSEGGHYHIIVIDEAHLV